MISPSAPAPRPSRAIVSPLEDVDSNELLRKQQFTKDSLSGDDLRRALADNASMFASPPPPFGPERNQGPRGTKSYLQAPMSKAAPAQAPKRAAATQPLNETLAAEGSLPMLAKAPQRRSTELSTEKVDEKGDEQPTATPRRRGLLARLFARPTK